MLKFMLLSAPACAAGIAVFNVMLWQPSPLAPRPATDNEAAAPITAEPALFGPEAFAGGSRYPSPVKVNLGNTQISAGEREARISVSISGPTANTVVAYVRCTWGDGAGPIRDQTKSVIFRPGDPLARSVACAIQPAKSGTSVRFVQSNVPDGAERGIAEASAIVVARAPQEGATRTGFRQPFRFQPFGELVYAADGAALQVNDVGGPQTWSTSLFHGRVQPSNGETGFYGEWALGGFQRRQGELVMTTRRLEKPVSRGFDGKPYPFLSVALSAHKMPEAQFRYGSVEWVVRMPNRRHSWPALWLLPEQGWPPEIDVYEGFGYNSDWNFSSHLSTNLHGGKSGQRTFTRLMMRMEMGDFGLRNTLDTEFHSFQARVEPSWITIFVDGIETVRYANPFQGTKWYPLMTVAVKAPPNSAYDDGSGSMEIRSVRVWRQD